MSRLEQAMERVKLFIQTKVCEFRLIHRQTFGPEPRWAAGFGRNPGQDPDFYVLGREPEEAIEKACDELLKREGK